MHKKYAKQMTDYEESMSERDQKGLFKIVTDRETRHNLQGTRVLAYQLADILKFMGFEKWSPDFTADACSLWAYVKTKEDIEAFNKIVWSFGFNHVSTIESDSICIKFRLNRFSMDIHYYFTDDADCKLVKVGTKTVDVFERWCGDDEDVVKIDASTIAVGIPEEEEATA